MHLAQWLAAIVLSTASAAWAQRAALLQDVDDGARVPYQQVSPGSRCRGSAGCSIGFPVVAPGHRVVAGNLSCLASLTGGSIDPAVALSSGLAVGQPTIYVSLVRSGPLTYAANARMKTYFDAGEYPRIDAGVVSGGVFADFSCTLTGRDVTLP